MKLWGKGERKSEELRKNSTDQVQKGKYVPYIVPEPKLEIRGGFSRHDKNLIKKLD